MSCPVWVMSWYPMCRPCKCVKRRSRSELSVHLLSRKPIHLRQPAKKPAMIPAQVIAPAQNNNEPLCSMPRSTPSLNSCGIDTLPALHMSPMTTPCSKPVRCSRSTLRKSFQPSAVAGPSCGWLSACDIASTVPFWLYPLVAHPLISV